MTCVIIAEKPDMGRKIASAIADDRVVKISGGLKVRSGGRDIIVTHCIGHVLEYCPPAEQDPKWKEWSLDTLPINPPRMKMKSSKTGYKQLPILKKIISSASEIIHAGDSDREGQIIVDEVLLHCNYRGPVKRMWINEITPKWLKRYFLEAYDNSKHLGLRDAGMSRQKADWVVGMTMSRAMTLHGQKETAERDMVLSYGRVQTPTLRLIVDRTVAIRDFVSKDYFVPKIVVSKGGHNVTATWVPNALTEKMKVDDEKRILEKAHAEKVASYGKEGAIVGKFSKANAKKNPPKPYTLGTLTKDCSSLFGFTAKKTLDVAQSLYEKHGMTSYPRTDCSYIPDTKIDELPEIKSKLAMFAEYKSAAIDANVSNKSSYINSKKIKAHYAIIPTTEVQNHGNLNDDEKKVYALIVRSFLAQFHEPAIYAKKSVEFKTKVGFFRANASVCIKDGWEKYYKKNIVDDEGDAEAILETMPDFSLNEKVKVVDGLVDSSKTTPPKPFDDGSLIAAMTSVHKFVENEELKRRLKENDGIGTEATRPNIIEELTARGFVSRKTKGKKKILEATQYGIYYIEALPDKMSDPGMTAIWERGLKSVEAGTATREAFLSHISRWVDGALIGASKIDFSKLKGKTPKKKISKKYNSGKPYEHKVQQLIKVDYDDRDAVKALGAKWHPEKKSWYIPQGVDKSKFTKFLKN